jgi:alkaline phosphatase D
MGLALLAFLPKRALASLLASAPNSLQRVSFGSCARQWEPQPIWRSISAAKPDLFLFLGDNVYNDTEIPAVMAENYAKLAAIPEFAAFRATTPILATWDDHDYGFNDNGAEFAAKTQSRAIMLDFFGEPGNSPRRHRSGIYQSYYFGEAPSRLQVILLDLRWNRTPIFYQDDTYLPHPDPNATMLGEEQWQWLEAELQKPADLRIIGSSIQLVSQEHRWEKWANYPADKARLFRALDRHAVRNAIFLSGDMHYGEISRETTPGGIPVFDLTASGLNYSEPGAHFLNRYRLGIYDSGVNFGHAEIDWARRQVSLQVRDLEGRLVLEQVVNFTSEIS